MANWKIDWWPWGGVQLCLSEAETQTVLNAADAGSTFIGDFSAAPPPVDIVAAIIAAFLEVEKQVAQHVDQGNGICFTLTWAAIAAGVPAGVIPYPNGSANPQQPGDVVEPAVSSVTGGVSLFETGTDGLVRSTYYDPQVASPQWAAWFSLPADQPFGSNNPVAAVSSVPGGVSLFATGTDGLVRSTSYDPRVANPQWSPWFSLPADQPFDPGTPVTAVSSGPGAVSLFATGKDGLVRSTYYDPQVANPQWAPWFSLPADQPFGSHAPVAAVSSVPGGVTLFATGTDGLVRSTYYDPRVANPQWSPWFSLPADQPFQAGTLVAAVSSEPGGISLFVTGKDGLVRSTYYDPQVANPQWAPWFPLPADQPFGAATFVAAVSSVPGGVSIFATGTDGLVRSTFYDPRVANPQWGAWFSLPADQPFGSRTPVSAVSSVPGGVSLFAMGKDGVVRSTYYDPRVANPQWVAWFTLPPAQP